MEISPIPFISENEMKQYMKEHPDKRYILTIYADYCYGCKFLIPQIKSVIEQEKYDYIFCIADLQNSDFTTTVTTYNIRAIPITFIMDYNKETDSIIHLDHFCGTLIAPLTKMLNLHNR